MKVTMYKSNDGKLHDNKFECEKHDAMLAAAPAIMESIRADHALEGDNHVLSLTDICTWAVKNATQLVEILTPFVPAKPRVPRKSKAAVSTTAAGEGASAPESGAVIAKAMSTQSA